MYCLAWVLISPKLGGMRSAVRMVDYVLFYACCWYCSRPEQGPVICTPPYPPSPGRQDEAVDKETLQALILRGLFCLTAPFIRHGAGPIPLESSFLVGSRSANPVSGAKEIAQCLEAR